MRSAIHNPRSKRAMRAGFTLVEAVAAMVVISLIGSVSGGLIFQATEGYRVAGIGAQLHAELASAIDPIDRSLRTIRCQSGLAAPDIAQVRPASMTWNGGSGVASISVVAGELLFSADGEPATPVLTDVSAISIRCFNESNALMAGNLIGAQVNPVRRIELTISVTRSGLSETLRTKVFLRGLVEGGS